MTSQNRDFFRLEYPPEERPRLIVGSTQAVILNLSEGGCFAEVSSSSTNILQVVGAQFTGQIVFADGDSVAVAGEILRIISAGRVAIRFSSGLTFAKMMSEHRRIREKYG